MENNDWLVYNGTLQSARQPVVSAQSRGLMYGDGCFETFRSYSGQFLALKKHMARLREGMQFLDMAFPKMLDESSIQDLLHNLLAKNKLLNKDAVVRMQVWREGGRGYHVTPHSAASFSIMASEYSPDKSVNPVSLATVDIKRIPDQALPSRFKLSNGINYITAARQAGERGADDALMFTLGGHVSETTIANVFWVKENTIYTPSEACDLLPGITRGIIIEILNNSPVYKVEEGTYTLKEILDADAVWLCNSVRELVPVSRVNDHTYPPRHVAFSDINQEFTGYRNQKLAPLI